MTMKAIALSLCGLALLAGCGRDPYAVTPPDSPGTVEGLVGTAWEWEGLVVTFQAPPSATVQRLRPDGRTGPPVPMNYEIEDGVVRMNVFGERTGGTWDGHVLVVDGMPAARRSN